MEKNKVFVLSDIHGAFDSFKSILKYWHEEEEQLVILGDLADRGPKSKEALLFTRQLVEEKEAILIKGNHDDMLEKYLKNPRKHQGHYYMNGGESTLRSLLGDEFLENQGAKNAKRIKEDYPWLLPFLESLRYFYEWEDYLFVHAGVDLTLDHWRDSSKRDFIWIREGFYDQKNTTDKRIVFGHTVTSRLHGNFSNFEVWKTNDGLIGIDGGAVYGGQLNALSLSKEGIENSYSIPSKQKK